MWRWEGQCASRSVDSQLHRTPYVPFGLPYTVHRTPSGSASPQRTREDSVPTARKLCPSRPFPALDMAGDEAHIAACASVSAVRCAGVCSPEPERAFKPVHQWEPGAVCRRLCTHSRTRRPRSQAQEAQKARRTRRNRNWRQTEGTLGTDFFLRGCLVLTPRRAERGGGRA